MTIKAVVLDERGGIRQRAYVRTGGHPLAAARTLLAGMAAEIGDLPLLAGVVTGSGKDLLAPALGLGRENEIVAHAVAAWTLHPEVASVIEIGGQDSKFIRVGRSPAGVPHVAEHAWNELCAAGTGAFLEQMAERLHLGVEELGALAARAPRVARVAGRCAVFAKSDLIHLQQRACPLDEMAAGLCFALARTYLASLCHGQAPPAPVLLQGGVAANQGVVRAFRELLGLPEGGLIRPEPYLVMGALGAALLARSAPLAAPLTVGDLLRRLPRAGDAPIPSGLPALADVRVASRPGPPPIPPPPGSPLFLGLAVGSVSTKGVLIDADGGLAASAYLPTAGRPVTAVRAALVALAGAVPADTLIAGSVTTGSGRHLAHRLLDADEAIDEITAQARSAAHFAPEADTVFEIGDQDSKYLRLAGGQVTRFQMNRACAAGTGAFLEEQAGRLGVDVHGEMGAAALAAPAPVRLGSRCTVFMDSDLVHHLQRGESTGDLCAGLAYSIGRNFLD